ncbi:hypothetical protein ACI7RC_15595 [Brevibacillus sp. B_LB10_24]|uniref:hypothetical protein n=1 Tax=Brevibacillus sp. B_LB10_24 TaxID=3380645 RepID=UPI0038BB1A0A
MKERNILAGFRNEDAAHAAAKQLHAAGFDTVQVDVIGTYPGDGVEKVMNPISGDIPSLGSLTLGADFPTGRDASILAAADPAASGMSDGGQETVGRSVLLTAVVPEDRADEAKAIITAADGEV